MEIPDREEEEAISSVHPQSIPSDEALWEEAMVQDDSREQAIAAYLGLNRLPGRAGADAVDEDGRPYELKSTTVGDVGTARDVGPTITAAWRTRYWIVAVGRQQRQPRTGEKRFRTTRLLLAHPKHLEREFARIDESYRSKYEPCERVLQIAQQHGADPEDLQIAKRWMDRGCRLNNPKIGLNAVPWTDLDPKDPDLARAQLQAFVKQHPL